MKNLTRKLNSWSFLLKSKNLSESTFKRRVEYWGFELQYKERSKHKEHKVHKNKGECIKLYKLLDNQVFIPKNEVTSTIRKYCSINKIKIIRL